MSDRERTHRWRRARAGDPEYGRVCECGALKDEQALRCRACYADERRNEAARTCAECGGPKSRDCRYRRCRACKHARARGIPAAGRPQRRSHPWRARAAYAEQRWPG